MSEAPAAAPAGEAGWTRWLPALLVPVSLLPDLGAALPLRTYFFRDFTVTFLPLRLFAARELREGRFPLWNPYVFEGSFQLPALYPLDLLHVLWPSPEFVSWLLTLHLPLAALGAYWLARELGASRAGAFVSGSVFALGGFALSCLNLYVFLQALALTPFVAGLTRRAAREGGRRIAAAAVVLSLALSTLAVEFVVQALVLGVALGLAERPNGRGAARVGCVVALAAGLAALPIGLTSGLLPETVRGAGLPREVVLANAVHPVVFLQTLVPYLFGVPSAPASAWWGSRFFSHGVPYFLSVYVGPLAAALALGGVREIGRRARTVLLSLAALGLWYALGEPAGLASVADRLPLASAFRFPSKALLLPYVAFALGAGFGAGELVRDAAGWRAFAVRCAGMGGILVAVAVAVSAAPAAVVTWSGVLPSYWPHAAAVVRGDAWRAIALLATAIGVSWVVRHSRATPALGGALVCALAIGDLARVGSGLNPQVSGDFFAPLREIAALHLSALDGGRVFSYASDQSPAVRASLARQGGGRELATFYAHRQVLGPYANVLDRVESPEAVDLTSFTPRPRELGPADYAPSAINGLLPWLRNAAVVRVLSLDPLEDPRLTPLASVPIGREGLVAHAYALESSWPRAYVACRVFRVDDTEAALDAPYRADFQPAHDVALAGGAEASCHGGVVRRLGQVPGRERYEVEADGRGYLVMRDSFARGWRAWVDGVPVPVSRANGKHRAVPVQAGRHAVELRYAPPGWLPSLLATGLAWAVVSGIVWTTRGAARG